MLSRRATSRGHPPAVPSAPRQVEAISDSDTESRSQREFHSIGVQVEEDKRYHATGAGLRLPHSPHCRPGPCRCSLSPTHHHCPAAPSPALLQLRPPPQSSAPSWGRIWPPLCPHTSGLPGEGVSLLLPCPWAGAVALSPAQVKMEPLGFSAAKRDVWAGAGVPCAGTCTACGKGALALCPRSPRCVLLSILGPALVAMETG